MVGDAARLGLAYDLFGNGKTAIRGGTGIFTGKPAFVWISNQIGNTGVLSCLSVVYSVLLASASLRT